MTPKSPTRITFITAAAILWLAACDSSNQALEVRESADIGPKAITAGSVDVYNDFILQSAEPDLDIGALSPLNDNLLVNGGLEQGQQSWFNCKGSGGSSITTDAVSGSSALQLEAGNCVYNTTVAVSQADELVLSCTAKTSDFSMWAAIGMGFANEKWQSIGAAPSALVTSGSFSTYSVSGFVPKGTKYVSVWFYSDSAAVIDDCQLLADPQVSDALSSPDDADDTPDPSDGGNNTDQQNESPTDTENRNLLSNESFAPSATGIRDWFIGCDSKGIATTDTSGNLLVSDNACVAQSLDATDMQALRGNTFMYECKAVKESKDYADIVIGFNGIETAESSLENGSFKIIARAPDNATNGFVGIYSELGSKTPLLVDSCSLSILDTPDSDDNDQNTDQGDTGNTDTSLDLYANHFKIVDNTIQALSSAEADATLVTTIPAPQGLDFSQINSVSNNETLYVIAKNSDTQSRDLLIYRLQQDGSWVFTQSLTSDSRSPRARDYTPVYDSFASNIYFAGDIMVINSTIGVVQTRSFGFSENQLDVYQLQNGLWRPTTGIDKVYPNKVNVIREVVVTEDEIIFSTYPWCTTCYRDAEVAVIKRDEGGPNSWGISQVIPKPDGLNGFGSPLELTDNILRVGSYSDTSNYQRDASGGWIPSNAAPLAQ